MTSAMGPSPSARNTDLEPAATRESRWLRLPPRASGYSAIALLIVSVVAACLYPSPAWAGEFFALSPQDFVRGDGDPQTSAVSFSVVDPGAYYFLRVHNGGSQQQYSLATGALLLLNGEQVLEPSDFEDDCLVLSPPVFVQDDNTLTVEVWGEANSGVTVEVIGVSPGEFFALSPQDLVRGTGDPEPVTTQFPVLNSSSEYFLRIYNGGKEQQYNRITDALISVNGELFVDLGDLPIGEPFLSVAVPLLNENVLSIEVRGEPDSGVTVEVVGIDPGEFSASGPRDFVRSTGGPVNESVPFSVLNPSSDYFLRIYNGGKEVHYGLISSGLFYLNDEPVFEPNDFGCMDSYMARQVALLEDNLLLVQLRSGPGTGVTVEVVGVDTYPPLITAIADPPPNPAGWNNSSVTVSFECVDAISEVVFCAEPVLVETEGPGQEISGTAVDVAGNTATTTLTLNIDLTPPQVTPPAPRTFAAVDAAGTPATEPAIATFLSSVEVSDNLDSSVTAVAVSPPSVFPIGSTTVTFAAVDTAENSSSATSIVTVADLSPPVITSPQPISVAGTSSSGLPATDPAIAAFLAGASATDNVDGQVPVSVLNPPSQFPPGSTIVTFVASDSAGNTATATSTVFVEYTPPPLTLTITEPADGEVLGSTPIVVRGQVSDPDARVVVQEHSGHHLGNRVRGRGFARRRTERTDYSCKGFRRPDRICNSKRRSSIPSRPSR